MAEHLSLTIADFGPKLGFYGEADSIVGDRQILQNFTKALEYLEYMETQLSHF
jgi:hypothetical protein